MAAKRVVVVRKKQDSGKPVQKSVKVEVKFNLVASIGDGDRERSYEEWLEELRKAVNSVRGAGDTQTRFTPTGGYYIVNGRVCLPEDFDPETKDFKPGTHPPLWASTEPERKQWEILDRIERDKERTNHLSRRSSYLATLEESAPPRKRNVVLQHGRDFEWDSENDAEAAAHSVTEKAAAKLVGKATGKRVVVVQRRKKP